MEVVKVEKDNNQCRNVSPLSFNTGDTFYAQSIPLEYATTNIKFDVKKSPRLCLKSPLKSLDLTPEMDVFHWEDRWGEVFIR